MMRFSMTMLSMVLLLLVSLTAHASDLIKNSERLINQGQYFQALEQLEQSHDDSVNKHYQLARVNALLGNYDVALSQVDKTLAVKISNDEAKVQAGFGLRLLKAELLRRKGRYQDALPLAQELLNKALQQGSSSVFITRARFSLASVKQYLADYQEAFNLFQQVQQNLQQLTAFEKLRFYNEFSILFYVTGNYDQGIAVLNQAQVLLQTELGEQHPEAGETFNNLAAMYAAKANLSEAEQFYRLAVNVRASGLGETHPDYATTMNNLAVLLQQNGRYSEAKALLEEVLQLRVSVLGDQHPFVQTTRSNLSLLYKQAGKYNKALKLQKQSASSLQKTLGQQHPDYGFALLDLADTYIALQDFQSAGHYLKQSLSIGNKLSGNGRKLVLESLDRLGAIALKSSRHKQAQSTLTKAEQVALKLYDDHHPRVLELRANLGAALVESGQLKRANKLLGKLQQSDGAYGPVSMALLNSLGIAAFRSGEVGLAVNYLRDASNLAMQYESVENRLDIAANYALALHRSGNLLDAEIQYQQAVQDIEAIFISTKDLDPDLRSGFLGRYAAVYENYLELLVELNRQLPDQHYDKRILSVIAMDQSRIFTELMVQANAEPLLSDLSLKDHLASIEDSLQYVNYLRSELLKREMSGEQISDAFYSDISNAEADYQQLKQQLADQYPEYYALKNPLPVSLEELQQKLQQGELLLVYKQLANQLLVFAINDHHYMFKSIRLDKQRLFNLVSHVHRATDGQRGVLALKALDPEKLHLLYQYLLKEPEAMLDDAKRVTVSASGILYTLPFNLLVSRYDETDRESFNTLRQEAVQPLFGEYQNLSYVDRAFRYIPGLSSFVMTPTPQNNAAYKKSLVAFADPVFPEKPEALSNSAQTQWKAVSRSLHADPDALSGWLPRLENTAEEASNIARLFGKKASVYLRNRADESLLKSLDLTNTRYLHFATHGLLSGDFEEAGAQPSLALTLTNQDSPDDGFLNMQEVINLNLNTELVMLSACNTAGETQAAKSGEGFAGLTRAFMFAGAKKLVVSHWGIDTYSSQQLTESFYRHIRDGQQAENALNQAMLGLRGKVKQQNGLQVSYAHPFFWSPFVVVDAQ